MLNEKEMLEKIIKGDRCNKDCRDNCPFFDSASCRLVEIGARAILKNTEQKNKQEKEKDFLWKGMLKVFEIKTLFIGSQSPDLTMTEKDFIGEKIKTKLNELTYSLSEKRKELAE